MKITKIQDRFIKNKSMGFSLMKGKSLTGKTFAALYRVINLENNYCIYNDDKILFLGSNKEEVENCKCIYEKESERSEFYSLFSLDEKRTDFTSISELIKIFAQKYKLENKISFKFITSENAYKFLTTEEFHNSLIEFSKKSKLLSKMTMGDLYSEIIWIKACNFTREEYIEVNRKGRRYRIIKNSYSRDSIYTLMEIYTSILWDNGYHDAYDEIAFAIKYGQNIENKYKHIILDDVQKLTKGEIDFAKSLYCNDSYSSFVFIINNEVNIDEKAWLIKGRKFKSLGADFKGKGFTFKKEFGEIKNNKYIDKFQYVNLKHKNIVEFNIDNSLSKREIYLDDAIVFSEEELMEVNIYNDIAAGNPIEINEDIEEKFYLPKGWLERGKETFILHVKGDSMIEKNINDGDLVVIKKQNTAYNNDIVAASLNGEATLKTIKLNGKEPMLVPANSKYSEIYLDGKDVNILGVAIGIIKK